MTGRIGASLQSTPAITCMKTMLMVFNFIFWVSGIAILALGVWTKVQLYMYIELTTNYYNEAPYVLIGVGAGIIVVGSLGCMCTVKGKAVLLYMFAVFLILVFIVELGVGIGGFVFRGKLEKGFEEGIQDAMKKYASDEGKQKAMDGLQEGLKCCGQYHFNEWFNIKWEGPNTQENSVPESCCNGTAEGCNLQVTNGTTKIYTEGCFSKVTTFMEKNFGIIGGVAIGFAFLQLFGALLACSLAKNLNKAKYEQVA